MHKSWFNQGLNDFYGLKTNLFIFQTFSIINRSDCQGMQGGFKKFLC